MGTLIDPDTGNLVLLRTEHVFGRSPMRADTVIDDREVSLIHAVVRWRDGAWTLVDHSRNGTFLDGRALVRGTAEILAVNQTIRLGRGSGATWRVRDVDMPADSLVPRDATQPVIALSSHNLLPDSESPELCIYEARPGQWILEQNGETRTLEHGDAVALGVADSHFFASAASVDDTRVATDLEDTNLPSLVFRLSLDEEHARLEIQHGRSTMDLGERSHHYCLATLARQRLSDERRGLEPGAQGWLSSGELARMLGLEITHLNMQIFRAREQLMKSQPGVSALARLIERRRGELRIGQVLFEVYRGDRMEGCYRISASAPDAAAVREPAVSAD